jgi:hypothetical protein
LFVSGVATAVAEDTDEEFIVVVVVVVVGKGAF